MAFDPYDPLSMFQAQPAGLARLSQLSPLVQPLDRGERGYTPMQEEEASGRLKTLTQAGLGALHYVGGSLAKAFGGRAIRGALGGKPEELLSVIPFSDLAGITKEENQVTGEDLARQWGWLEGEGEKGKFEMRDLVGPAIEIG